MRLGSRKEYLPLPNYHIAFFETESGAVPAEEFIDSLDMKMSAKIYHHERICEEDTGNAKI